MQIRKLGFIVLVSFCFVMAVGAFNSCEPGGTITYVNTRNEDVTIYYSAVLADGTLDNAVKQAVIPANGTKKFGAVFLGSDFIKRIVTTNPSGKVVFLHDYKMADLDKIGWTITIPP